MLSPVFSTTVGILEAISHAAVVGSSWLGRAQQSGSIIAGRALRQARHRWLDWIYPYRLGINSYHSQLRRVSRSAAAEALSARRARPGGRCRRCWQRQGRFTLWIQALR